MYSIIRKLSQYWSSLEGLGLCDFGDLGRRRDHHVDQGYGKNDQEDVEDVVHVRFEVFYGALAVGLVLVIQSHLGLLRTVGDKGHRCHIQGRD